MTDKTENGISVEEARLINDFYGSLLMLPGEIMDWNHLMPLVEKIRGDNSETTGCIIDISFDIKTRCTIQVIKKCILKKKVWNDNYVPIIAVYKSAVEYIKFLNQQPK